MKFFRRNSLLITLFITGACILIIELAALRVLTPFFGNTIFSTTSVITTVLFSLSVGYYLGGRISDKQPYEKIFYFIILISGLLVLLVYVLIVSLLADVAYSLDLTTGPLIVSLGLFLVPSILLGMLSPYVITLQKIRVPEDGVGKVSGNVFFVSTLGSIFGSLLTGFYLIPQYGSREIIFYTGLLLTAIGAIGYFSEKTKIWTKLIAIFIVVLAVTANFLWSVDGAVYAKDGIYTYIKIADANFEGRPARFFLQDNAFSSGIYLDGDDLAFEYSKYFDLYKLFTDDISRVYIIGAGTYSLPKVYVTTDDDVVVDVVDIEPGLEDLAKQYFGLNDTSRINTFVVDGRRMLHDNDQTYDVIFSDVYFGRSIPSQFTTVEFFELTRSRLTEEGVVFLNVIGSLDEGKEEFLFSQIKTFQSVYPNSIVFATVSPQTMDSQNFVFVGTKSDQDIRDVFQDSGHGEFQDNLLNLDDHEIDSYTTFTDNYAPVDFMNAKAAIRD